MNSTNRKKMLWKLILGGLCVIAAFTALPNVQAFLITFVVGCGLLVWGLVPWFRARSGRQPGIPDPKPAPWTIWDESVHLAPGQADRMERAVEQEIHVLKADKNGVYTVLGSTSIPYRTTFGGCTCEDFQRRGIPCKHMYKLAQEQGVFDPVVFLRNERRR